MDWIIKRLKEPSSWRGLVIIVSICGYSVSPELQDQIIALGTAAIGLIEIIRREKTDAGKQTEPVKAERGRNTTDTLPDAAGNNP